MLMPLNLSRFFAGFSSGLSIWLSFSFFGAIPVQAQAQIKNPTNIAVQKKILSLPDSIVETFDPVIITGDAVTKKSSDLTFNAYAINSKTMQQMAAQNISDVLKFQPSIMIAQDGVLGAGMSMQGLGGQSVKILIDGVPMVGRLNGNIDLGQIPVSQIERIEVVEGPMSVMYGSDAVGGIINVITKQAKTKQIAANFYKDGTKNTNFDFSSNWLLRKSTLLTENGGINKKGVYCAPKNYRFEPYLAISGGRQYFDGIDFDTSNRSYNWKPKTKYFGSVEWGLLPTSKILKTLPKSLTGNNSTHRFKLNYFNESLLDRSNAEYNLISITGYNNRFYTNRLDFTQISSWKRNVSSTRYVPLILQLTNGFNGYYRHNTLWRRNLVTGDEVLSNPKEMDTTLNLQWNSRLVASIKSSNKIQWVTGYESNVESLKTNRLLAHKPITDIGLYAQMEYKPLNALSIRPGVRLIYNSAFGSNPLPQILGSGWKFAPLLPSLQLRYHLSKHLTFRASAAQAFRSPSIKELYFLFVDINHNVRGNSALKPELANSLQGSLDYKHSYYNFNKHKMHEISFGAKGFYNHIQRQIQLSLVDPTAQLYQYINVGKVISYGGTGEFAYSQNKWQIGSGITQIYSKNWITDSSNAQQWHTLQASINSTYRLKKQHAQIQCFVRYSGKNFILTSDGQAFTVHPYTWVDLNANKTFSIARNKKSTHALPYTANLQVGCKNLLNVTQIAGGVVSGGVHSSSNGISNVGMGRNYFVSLNLQF